MDALLNTTSLEQATDYILSHPPPAAISAAAQRVSIEPSSINSHCYQVQILFNFLLCSFHPFVLFAVL